MDKISEEDLKELRLLAMKCKVMETELQNIHLLFDNSMLRLYIKYHLDSNQIIDIETGKISTKEEKQT